MKQTVRKTLAAAAALIAAPRAQADSGWSLLNMPVGVTELSKQIYELHMTIFWICVAIAVAVFGVMTYAIVTFRKSAGACRHRRRTPRRALD